MAVVRRRAGSNARSDVIRELAIIDVIGRGCV
jgi:hypothetical protein